MSISQRVQEVKDRYSKFVKKRKLDTQVRAEKAARREEERLDYLEKLEESKERLRKVKIRQLELAQRRMRTQERLGRLQQRQTASYFPGRSSAGSFLGSQLGFGGGGTARPSSGMFPSLGHSFASPARKKPAAHRKKRRKTHKGKRENKNIVIRIG